MAWQKSGNRPGTEILTKTFWLKVKKSPTEINVLTLTNAVLVSKQISWLSLPYT